MSRWYSVRLNTASELEISIFDVIGGDEDDEYDNQPVDDLTTLIRECGDKAIRLFINSPGGDVWSGFNLYNALASHPKPVAVEIIGIAGSIASYIAMAGKTVAMCENGLFMIHNVNGTAGGDSDDLRTQADLLDKCQASILAAYNRRTKLGEAKLTKMMAATTILGASEALAFGFIDSITQPLLAAASFDTKHFSQSKNKMKLLTAASVALLNKSLGLTLTEDADETTITNALAPVLKVKTDFPDLENRVTALTRERDHLTAQFGELTKTADGLKTEVADVKNQIGTLTTDRDAIKGKLDLSASNVARLEKLCSLKGIDPASAIPDVPPPDAKVTIGHFEDRIGKERDPRKRAMIVNEFNTALAKGIIAKN